MSPDLMASEVHNDPRNLIDYDAYQEGLLMVSTAELRSQRASASSGHCSRTKYLPALHSQTLTLVDFRVVNCFCCAARLRCVPGPSIVEDIVHVVRQDRGRRCQRRSRCFVTRRSGCLRSLLVISSCVLGSYESIACDAVHHVGMPVE